MRGIVAAALLTAACISQNAWAQSNVGPPANPIFQLSGMPITTSFTTYSFSFTAASNLTNLTFAFRDDPAFLTLDNVTFGSTTGPNLLVNGNFELGPVGSQAPSGWTYVNQYGASAAGVLTNGTGVGGSIGYLDGAVQAYDAITQGVSTVVGNVYSVTFALKESGSQATYSALSTNGNTTTTSGNGVNLAVYAQNGIPTLVAAVPEPATWAMMILGFGLVGYGMRRVRAKSEAKFNDRIKLIALGDLAI